MTSQEEHSLERRIEELERRVRLLETQRPAAPPGPRHEGPRTTRPERRPRSTARSDAASSIRKALRSEDLINKVGILLLLIGMAFLYKWGIDRGWITPTVRVIFGFVLGAGLIVFGSRIRSRRVRYGQVLIGGGIATLYITLFSAFQLYSLLTYPVAFTLMTGVTAVSYGLSLRQSDVALAIIATGGGLGTPFILFEGPTSILWLVVYTVVISACATAIYFEKGWRSLLLVTAIGSWSVMSYAWSEIVSIGFVPLADRAVYQLGVLLLLVLFGFVPAVRDLASGRRPDRWPTPPVRRFLGGALIRHPSLWLSVVAPLISLALSHRVWDLSDTTWGAIEVVVATAYWAVHLYVKTTTDSRLASSYSVASALILAVSWFHLFENESLWLLALAVEATAIHVATYVSPDRALRTVGHALFGAAAFWTFGRLMEGTDAPSIFSGTSLTHIAVFVLALGSSALVRSHRISSAYRVVVALLLAVAWFSFFPDGTDRFLALSLQATALILWTQYFEDYAVRITGHFLFGVALLAIDWRLTSLNAGTPPLLNTVALVDLAVIVIATGCSFLLLERNARLIYRFAAYVAFLGWFWRDLAPIENGHAFISLAWGVIAVVLIMMGWRSGRDIVRITGLTTLGAVVLKLFVIDLAELGAGWRVVLFIGLGALLLVASYLFPSIWRGDAEQLKSPELPSDRDAPQPDD